MSIGCNRLKFLENRITFSVSALHVSDYYTAQSITWLVSFIAFTRLKELNYYSWKLHIP